MSAAAIGIATAIIGTVIAASRAATTRRIERRVRSEAERRVRPDGVIVGAETVILEGTGDGAALLLHGFNDTPQSLAHLGAALHARGWTVVIPLLAQHGRGADVFLASGSASAWIRDAREAWQDLARRSRNAVLVGQSMGGAIATILAAEKPPSALILLAPYLSMGAVPRLLSRIWPAWQLLVPRLASNPERALRDADARAASLGGSRFSPRLVAELRKVVEAARLILGRLTAPTLVVHASSDYRIPSAAAQASYERIGARDKTLIWSTRGGHIVAADQGRDEVITNVVRWLEERVALNAPPSGNTFDVMRKH